MEFKENEKTEVTGSVGIYPTVPTAPPTMDPYTPMSYRLQKINEIQRMLEDERDVRQRLSKKYHRVSKGISNADAILVASSMGLGVAGVGLLSTIVAAPVVIIMEAAALGTGLMSIICGQVNKRMISKAEKHEKIKTIAEAKLNTISDLVSKALNDNVVSQEEFTLILNELAKYRQMKEEVRSNVKVALDEETKSSLIKQGREDAIDSFQKMFNKNRESFRRIINTPVQHK
ncbi:hypothetical protein CAPTEDRAFT_213860 [Capitella teleta]|uniref:Uncharacterized protein n=1 Tax=Capitella teleta TaxID=283909 RepID=R7VBW0_CAPTE|nr:hypothetical protein CAPTEDRAFT_213860 [Capitella teleta]|eukprot:ELU13791.1 hypothetical protein CAPTEDRAFT_213860 [Capitella teleta]